MRDLVHGSASTDWPARAGIAVALSQIAGSQPLLSTGMLWAKWKMSNGS
jgi:hypothetical protein